MSTSPLSFQNEEENQLLGPSSTSSNDGSSPSSSFTDSSDKRLLSVCSLISMFCFCFANGAMLSGYFLIVLPIESARIDEVRPSDVQEGATSAMRKPHTSRRESNRES